MAAIPPGIDQFLLQALSLGLPPILGATLLGWLSNQFRRGDQEYLNRQLDLSALRDHERTLQQELERLRIVLRMGTTLNSTLNYEHVLEMALDLAISAMAESKLDETRIKAAVLLFEDELLRVASARGLSKADLLTHLPGEQGIIGEVVTMAETRLSHDPPLDPEVRRLTAFHTCRSVACLPLVIGLKIYGVLLFGHRRPQYFTGERLEILETVAQQAVIALQNARLYRELEEEKERIMEIQEEARKKLARDLHDGPTQSVAAIAMRINFARRLMERDPQATAEELYKIEELARRTTKEIRQMLFTLRPLILETKGLVAAMKQLAAKIADAHGQQVIVDAAPDVAQGLGLNKQTMVFMIAEEALTNARKHAQARHVWVRMARRNDLFLMEVEDDGVGFNLGAIDSGYANLGSLGLVNMRERAELINGLLDIASEPGQGTVVSLQVPITAEAAELLHRPGFVNRLSRTA